MKRDMDLIRQILLAIEASPEPVVEGHLNIEGVDEGALIHHQSLLKDAGYIKAYECSDANTRYGFMLMDASLTWTGHEFLESIRDPEVWSKTKAGAGKVGSWSISLIADLGKAYAQQKARDLGLPV